MNSNRTARSPCTNGISAVGISPPVECPARFSVVTGGVGGKARHGEGLHNLSRRADPAALRSQVPAHCRQHRRAARAVAAVEAASWNVAAATRGFGYRACRRHHLRPRVRHGRAITVYVTGTVVADCSGSACATDELESRPPHSSKPY